MCTDGQLLVLVTAEATHGTRTPTSTELLWVALSGSGEVQKRVPVPFLPGGVDKVEWAARGVGVHVCRDAIVLVVGSSSAVASSTGTVHQGRLCLRSPDAAVYVLDASSGQQMAAYPLECTMGGCLLYTGAGLCLMHIAAPHLSTPSC